MKRLLWIPLLLISCQPAFALEDKQAVKCLLGEYESGNIAELTATAEALRNRIALMGENKALKGVYGCKAVSESSGVFKRGKRIIPNYAVKRAVKAWEGSKNSSLTKGGTHWEAIETFGKPKWAYKLTKTAKVGQHTFYK
jgi:hypothetical protein